MKNHLKSLSVVLCLTFLVFSLISPLEAQIRGKALYEKLTKEGRTLVKFEGMARVMWTPDGTAYYESEKDTFVRIDPINDQKSPLFDDAAILKAYNTITSKSVEKLPFRRFSYLDEGKKIRFMVGNNAYVYELATGKIISYVPERNITGVRGRIYSEVFSPDFKYRAFARDYNLYIQDLEGTETALTTDGHKDLRNGFPDWVYPEELSQYEAFWWSPDSKKIAFMQFDESPVSKYPIVHDISPRPELELQSYPKAGDNNPIINFFIVDIKSKEITRIEIGIETNVYLFRGQWTHDGKEFTYQRLNRLQNVLELFAADPETGKVRRILKYEDPCYIEANFDLRFLSDNQHFIWTSERSGWNEIYLYDLQGNLVKQLTNAKLPVRRILDVDEENGWVYFSGAEYRGMESHAYRVKLDGTGFMKLTREPGSHRVSFSPGGKYFTDSFSSWSTPPRTTLHRADGTLIRQLGKSIISEEFKSLGLIEPEQFTFKSADGKYELDGILYKPAHFDEKEKYPLIMSVYGGPGAKRIYNRFSLNDGSQALAQLGFIVIAIDHRGVSGRGKAFQNLMYMNLGQIELEDHVAAAKYIGQRPYVDENRVGIFGHSYGGYMTCIALLKAPDVFHVGVAGAPVTDWRNYDTIYTERYMRRPQDNPDGYKKGSCMNYAKDLKGNLFIHHGAVDNNVHLGNSIQLIQALQKYNKIFGFMIYPEQRHGIRVRTYGESRVEYFIDHLRPDVK
jgi:dipeptidyl-peptidase-4